MQKSLILALISSTLWLPASAHPKQPPQPKVTCVNGEENAYVYHNYRSGSPVQATTRVATAPQASTSGYNRAYAHFIPPDGFQGTPSPYSLGPGWANRSGSYRSGTTAYPYNAGGFYPGGAYTYYR